MNSAFLYLSACTVKNRLLARVRRLREPRYAIGLAVGIFYLYSTAFRHLFAARSSSVSYGIPIARFAVPMEILGALFAFVIAALVWLTPGSRRGVAFTQPEVQFLFTAPVTRRQLVHYKLLRSQIALLFGSAMGTLFLRPTSLTSAWMVVVGIWLMFTTSSLYLNGVALRRLSFSENGKSGVARQAVPIGIVLVATGILVWTTFHDWSTLASFDRPKDVFAELERLANTTPAWVVLWPFRAIVRLPLSATPTEFAHRLPVVLGLIAAMYGWALTADTSFEEAAAAQAEKRAAMTISSRFLPTKAKPTPFVLGITGRPEFALLWKNTIVMGRFISWRLFARLVPMFVAVGFAITAMTKNGQFGAGISGAIGIVALVLAAYAILLGPQVVRNDLRSDLANLQVLKTWPISGTELLRGELLAPWLVLSVVTWGCLILGAILASSEIVSVPTADRLAYVTAALLIAPGFILAQLVVQNTVAVLFPAWIAVGPTRARGIDAMGQRLLMLAGVLLTLIVALVPAAILGGAVGFGLYLATHTIPIVIPGIVVAASMLIECFVVVELLGGVVDRMDAGSVDAIEA